MKSNLKKTHWIHAIALGGVFGFSLTAEDVAPSLPEILEELHQRENLDVNIQELMAMAPESLVHRKLESTVLDLLADDGLTKGDRLEAFQLVQELSITKEAVSQDSAAEVFLRLEPKLTSPNLKSQAVEALLAFDVIKSSTITAKIDKLVQKIIADAAKDNDDQAYSATLHAACLKTIGGEKVSSSQISTVGALIEKDSELPPTLRLALYDAVVRISGSSSMKKNQKNSMAKHLVAALASHPALSGTKASETELENLLALLPAVGALMSDSDNSSYIASASESLLKTLEHPELNVLKAGGKALSSIADANLSKFKVNVEEELLKQSTSSKFKGEAATARLHIIVELLVQRFGELVVDEKTKGVDAKVEKILAFFFKTAMTHPDLTLQLKAMDGFFALEPSLLEKKTLNSASKKTIKSFMEKCIGFMGDEKFKKSFPEVIERMSEILHEISGRNFGTDGKLWHNWMRSEGKELFS